MIKKNLVLTPIALAAALAMGGAQAQGLNLAPRVSGAVGAVTGVLSGDRTAAGGNDAQMKLRGDRGVNARNDDNRLALRGDRESRASLRSLPGLNAADRTARDRVQASDDMDRDPIKIGVNLDTGNLSESDSGSQRGAGVKVAHSTALHLATPEDSSSPLDNDDTQRSGVDTNTKLNVLHMGRDENGDRQRVNNGIQTGAKFFRHSPKQGAEDAEAYNSASLNGYYVRKTGEKGDDIGDIVDDDENTTRIGSKLSYDSREGFEIENSPRREERARR